MSQSRAMSAIESVANILVGAGIALLSQIIVFPIFGIHIPLHDNLIICSIFTAVSFVRSYVLRRIFNRARRKI